MTNGLEETEAINILCKLRQIGLCIKSVGLTSGLVDGAHGILLKPDLTLADPLNNQAAKLVILTQGNRGVSQLETEPRLHQLLQHTLLEGGYVAVSREHQRILRATDISEAQLRAYTENHQILIRDRQQSFDAYISNLIRCFDASGWRERNRKPVRKLPNQSGVRPDKR
jgi:hypothetical protein